MPTTYFKELIKLLNIEKEEDLQSFLKLTESSSPSERRAAGLTWYPIAIRNTEMTRGDYITVEVERTTHQDLSHQLRFGASAVLFSNHDARNDRVEGTITYQSGERLKITLRTEELPDWSRNGKLGIDLLFDNNSYVEMQNALKMADSLADNREEGHLVKVLTGERSPSFQQVVHPCSVSQLNASQREAVDRILSARELAIVHGPPGTGKTTTLVQAIKALYLKESKQILVVAPSNTAVDLLTDRLAEEGLNVLRVGNPERVSERLMASTLENKMAEHSSMKEVRKLKKQAAEYKNMAHKYKRNYGKAEQAQRKALFNEAHRIMKEVSNTEQFIMDDLIAKAHVITATLVGSNHHTVRNLKYDTLVIDEAGQALETACWIPILKASKVILSGDHCQLPPTVKSNEAGKGGLNTTLLEKCARLHPESVVLLNEQYRMHNSIMSYSSKVFYEDKLKAHASVAAHLLFPDDHPLTFVDTAGCGFEEKSEGTSTSNPDEAVFLFRHLNLLINQVSEDKSSDKFPSVAIISPYKQQVAMLRDLLLSDEDLQAYSDKISVNTIDSFQGQERDVVYISMTRSNTEGAIGFLSDIRRMNVAMTRARKKLVVIGDSATLSRFSFYADFISYAEHIKGYQSAWDYNYSS